MRIEPAHVNQIRRARDGRMVEVDGDAGGVAEDLRRIDPHLKVRFAEAGRPPFWAVYWESPDQRRTELVLTAEAHQTNSGVWSGLDQRVVKRIEEIGHSSYDLAADLDARNARVERDRKDRFRDAIGDTATQAAHALRKDLGVRPRIFVP